jgi:hypothetical protein
MPTNISAWRIALWLAIVTVFYNVVEGVVSIAFGLSDDTLCLFGFGLDSFVEVISGIGIWHMVARIRGGGEGRDSFERTALRVTGISFYLLSAGLVISAALNAYHGAHPSTTLSGIVISSISIVTMIFLMRAKIKVGTQLHSDAIIADAHCTRTCVYLSVILLLSSILFAVFKIGYIDSIGAIGIAWYAFSEGRESFEKSRGKACCCHN